MLEVAHPDGRRDGSHLVVVDPTVDRRQVAGVVVNRPDDVIEQAVAVVALNFNIGVVVGLVAGWVRPVNGDDPLAALFGRLDVGAVGPVHRDPAALGDVADDGVARHR